jgi:hypothetical protein
MTRNQAYHHSRNVDSFESQDRQRLLLFKRDTGELLLLLDRSAELWRALNEGELSDLNPEDYLILESFFRKGFVEPREKSK